MLSSATGSSGALGGAAAEAGSEYRARVGALVATAVLRQSTLAELGLAEMPNSAATLLQVESDDPVDDLVVHMVDGAKVYIQAKTTAGLSTAPTSPFIAALDQFARAAREGLRPDDRLVLATARPTAGLERLGRLLERRRLSIAGNPATQELQALKAFASLAATRGIDASCLSAIADHLVVWRTDPTSGDGGGLLISRLEHHVVAGGDGLRAARELTNEVRHLARARGGRDALQLGQALAARGLDLHPGAPPTSPTAWARALAAHRRRLTHRGTTLALFGAPPELSHLQLDDCDAGIEVDVPDEDRTTGRRVELALRRRGRVLLVGAPGGGKSTALRAAAAHWAQRHHWPTPISVHLQRLAGSSGPLLEALLDVAVEEVFHTGERAALRAALGHELGKGRCLLLLDGLDEVRLGRPALVDELVRALGDLPEATEVLVATRPVAAPDAQPLGLHELPLRPPDHPERTVNAILHAAAPVTPKDDWIADRRRWVEQAIERDPALGRTPLTVVVLALIAVRSADPAHRPTTRAAVLHRALTDVIDGWEVAARLRGDVRIGALAGSRARHALIASLCVLATGALSPRRPSRQDALNAIASGLQDGFDLARWDACAAADDAVAFWTDSGLFAFDGGEVGVTIRQMAELGHAWRAVFDGQPPANDWVAETRASEELWPSLALGAGLSPAIAGSWAAAIADNGDADEFIALVDAVPDGVGVTPDALAATAEAVADRHLVIADDAERVAEALLRLSLPAAVRARLRPQLCAHVPKARQAVVDVLAITRWDERSEDAYARLRAFVAAPTPPLPDYLNKPVTLGTFVLPPQDDTHRTAREEAMLRLIPVSREDAERVLERFDDGSMEYRSRLCEAFRVAGHPDLADGVNAELERSWAERRELWANFDTEALERWMFTTIAELAHPAPLTQLQLRRLDEIADLAETALLKWIWPGREVKHGPALAAWIRSAAELGSFDLGVLAAQARTVLEDREAGDETRSVVYDAGVARKLNGWAAVRDPEHRLAKLIEAISGIPYQASGRLMVAIVGTPIHRAAVELLESELSRYRIWARTLVARAIVIILSAIPEVGTTEADARAGVWLYDADPLIRRAAGTWWGFRRRSATEPGAAEFERCLDDSDAGVVEEAISMLDPATLDDDLRERLRAVRAIKGRAWVCTHCGHDNPPGRRVGCDECSTSGPDPAEAVDELLGERRTAVLGRPNRPRRIRRRR